MEGKSSYCVKDTSSVSKMILKRGKCDLEITESGICPVGIPRTLKVPARLSGSRYLGAGSLALSQLSGPSPGFWKAKYLETFFQNGPSGSCHQLRMADCKSGRKKQQPLSQLGGSEHSTARIPSICSEVSR